MNTQAYIRRLKRGNRIQTEIGVFFVNDDVPVSVFVVKKKSVTRLREIK